MARRWKNLGCKVLIFTCCMWYAGEAVILRPEVLLPKRPMTTRKPEVSNKANTPSRRRVFQATTDRCCSVGERVAKKKMICNVAVVVAYIRYKSRSKSYDKQKYTTRKTLKRSRYSKRRNRRRKLTEKILKCTDNFPKHYITCCTSLQKHLNMCRKKSRRHRKRCRKTFVRRQS